MTQPPEAAPTVDLVGFAGSENFEGAGINFWAIHVRGRSEVMFCYWTQFNGHNRFFASEVAAWRALLDVINAPGSAMDGYRSDCDKL